MNQFIRVLIVILALAGTTAWTIITVGIWQFGHAFKGMGDGSGAESASLGAALFAFSVIGAIWLLSVSPYLCMVAGSLNLLKGKVLSTAYVYSLMLLLIMTTIMLVTFIWALELMALGNIVAGGLWAYSFRENIISAGRQDARI